jgi:hypothetical protein
MFGVPVSGGVLEPKPIWTVKCIGLTSRLLGRINALFFRCPLKTTIKTADHLTERV